jgi:hypothetical protein
MSSLDLDLELDSNLNDLETEWRRAYRVCGEARAYYEQLLRDCGPANGGLVDVARLRMEQAEALKARLMVKMERTEDGLIGGS